MRPTERQVTSNGIALNVAEAGAADAPPLLLLHGLAARWQVFGPLLPHVTAAWRVLTLDFRGHGKSGRTGGDYTVPGFAADAGALLAGQSEAVVYGHSLGGWAGLVLAAEQPGSVRALVVADSAINAHDVDPEFAVSYLANLPAIMRPVATSLDQLDPAVMDAYHAGRLLDGYDPEALLPRVRCPVLLLQADPDAGGLMSDADVELATALLPDARHVKLHGLGHGLHVQDAAAVAAAVADFVSP